MIDKGANLMTFVKAHGDFLIFNVNTFLVIYPVYVLFVGVGQKTT